MTDTERIARALDEALPRIAVELQNALKIKAPVDTGRLRNSIKVVIARRGLEISIVDYALFVEFGRPPSIIVPKTKKALHWKSGGKDVFAKKVKHPGTRPNPFIRTALNQQLPRIIVKNIQEAL